MKRLLVLLFFVIGTCCYPVFSADTDIKLPKIFIYSIPEDETNSNTVDPLESDAPESDYVNELPEEENFAENLPDADTSSITDEINLVPDKENEPEEIVNATTLKGYAEYIEDSDAIYLRDSEGQFVLNLKVPQKITSGRQLDLANRAGLIRKKQISKYIKEEHTVADSNIESISKAGNFLFGTAYGQEVDNISMLENSTSLFSRYEREKFSLGSKFEKTMNTTIGTYSDVLSFEPEYKLNNYISVKEVLKANFTKNRRSSELVLSISPMGRQQGDRLRLEFGAKYTINQDNSLYGTQLNFSTKFKL